MTHVTDSSHSRSHCHSGAPSRLMFATVTVAVCHCGAGCLLGDVVGEWIVFGSNVSISGHHLWVAFLVGTLNSAYYLFASEC